MRSLLPKDIYAPFGNYSHGLELSSGQGSIGSQGGDGAGSRSINLVVTSGQLGVDPSGEVPASIDAQVRLCFTNIGAILREADLGFEHVVKLSAYLLQREDMPIYMKIRDEFLADCEVKPASTLMLVSGFTSAEMQVEIEAIAVRIGG